MVVKMRWLVEQLEGIKDELFGIYDIVKNETVFNAIDLIAAAIEETQMAIIDMEGGNDGE